MVSVLEHLAVRNRDPTTVALDTGVHTLTSKKPAKCSRAGVAALTTPQRSWLSLPLAVLYLTFFLEALNGSGQLLEHQPLFLH